MNQLKEKSKIITNSSCKRKLQQDEQKRIKTNKNQARPKQKKSKLNSRQSVKTKQKKLCQKRK